VRAARTVAKACVEAGIQVLTLFAFSSENWKRPADEVNSLMRLFVEVLQREVDELHSHGIQLRFIGAREHLPEIGRELTSATKTAEICVTESGNNSSRPLKDGNKEAAEELNTVAKQQEQVVAALEGLLSQLKQAEGYRRFHRELSLLLRDQEETARRTTDLGQRTLTKSLADLLAQETADLRILAVRQLEHARGLDRILQTMQQAAEQLRRDDPTAAETVAEALEAARRMAIGSSMRSCGENLRQNQIGQASSVQKEIVRQIQEVLDILDNRRNSELDRLEDAVKHLQARQEETIEQSDRLEQVRQKEGRLARSQLSTLRDIARLQRALQEDTRKLAEQVVALGVFHLTLNSAAADMGRAADFLDRRNTGAETHLAQQNALRRLNLLLEALKPEPPPENKEGSSAGGKGGPGDKAAKPPGEGIKKMAELKLLKLLQQEIQLRTAELQQAVGSGNANEEQRQQFAELADEQGRLADLVVKILQPIGKAPKENPENVPIGQEGKDDGK
jgi:hypothetical protein